MSISGNTPDPFSGALHFRIESRQLFAKPQDAADSYGMRSRSIQPIANPTDSTHL